MGLQEYLLLALVIFLPLAIAVTVTLWTLEQARLRSKKNRKGPSEPPSLEPDRRARATDSGNQFPGSSTEVG